MLYLCVYVIWHHLTLDFRVYSMQEALRHKATKRNYTRGMQFMAQMTEPTIERAQIGQNKDQNMLRWELKSLDKHAYVLTRKRD